MTEQPCTIIEIYNKHHAQAYSPGTTAVLYNCSTSRLLTGIMYGMHHDIDKHAYKLYHRLTEC